MKIPSINKVRSAEEARDLAIDWQTWQQEQVLSYSELVQWQDFFKQLGKKFNLTEEFEENAII